MAQWLTFSFCLNACCSKRAVPAIACLYHCTSLQVCAHLPPTLAAPTSNTQLFLPWLCCSSKFRSVFSSLEEVCSYQLQVAIKVGVEWATTAPRITWWKQKASSWTNSYKKRYICINFYCDFPFNSWIIQRDIFNFPNVCLCLAIFLLSISFFFFF